jgi:hypothetical protein
VCNLRRRKIAGMSHEIKLKQGVSSSNHTLGLQIGSVCCALKCRDNEVYNQLRQLYRNFLTEQSADITVEMEGIDRLSPDDLGEVLSETRYIHEGNRFQTNSQIITGQYDLANRIISITAERSLGDPEQEFNHLNRLISLAYYSACKVKYDGNPPAMLVHACGILRDGRVIVFAGPSESGKTSIARLCGDQHGEVLNDEMLLISRPAPDGNGISAQSAPIIGGLSARRNIAAPLRCILLLKRSNKTLIHYLDRAEAYLRLMRQIISPAHIGQRSGRAVYSLMADFSAELVKTIPIYELEFNLDGESLWQVVMELERMSGRGG